MPSNISHGMDWSLDGIQLRSIMRASRTENSVAGKHFRVKACHMATIFFDDHGFLTGPTLQYVLCILLVADSFMVEDIFLSSLEPI